MSNIFQRKVSPLERMFVLLHEMDRPFSNQVVLEGTGTFDKALWEKAIREACEANPGSRLILKGVSGWSKWVDSGIAAPIKVIENSDWSGYGPEGAPFLSDPLMFEKTHSCEVVLVPGNPLRAVFRTLHAIMDGRGTQLWVEDIFRALRGEPLVGTTSTINDEEYVVRLNNPQKWERKKRDCLAPTGDKDGTEPGFTWRRTRIEGKYSKLLPQAAIAIAKETRKQGPSNVCFNIPVDIRRWMPEIRSTANLTRRIILYVPPDATVESLSEEIKYKVNNMSREPWMLNLATWIPLGIMKYVFTKIRQKNLHSGVYHSTGTISNLGKLPIESYQGGGFQAETGFYIPPGTEGKTLFMTLSGCGDFVEVIISMPKTLATNGRLDQLLENVVAQLEPV